MQFVNLLQHCCPSTDLAAAVPALLPFDLLMTLHAFIYIYLYSFSVAFAYLTSIHTTHTPKHTHTP